ncbi:uncharacterized protein IUM83_04919 [Phytophthora cinnamomi]|uniref:uncharacterized protein n=1 Tax=Phytophthora cinnamomi TaxID=4785 RepID=UPI00355A8D12|nr:hypothetical protein IUM83_04919 [Phytophthora cinnamomi]
MYVKALSALRKVFPVVTRKQLLVKYVMADAEAAQRNAVDQVFGVDLDYVYLVERGDQKEGGKTEESNGQEEASSSRSDREPEAGGECKESGVWGSSYQEGIGELECEERGQRKKSGDLLESVGQESCEQKDGVDQEEAVEWKGDGVRKDSAERDEGALWLPAGVVTSSAILMGWR